jgi:hypothetical protein
MKKYTDQNHHHMLERGVMKAGIGPEIGQVIL